MSNRKKITSMILAGVLIVGLPYSSFAAKKTAVKKPVQVQYVALGDSLAAGKTPTGFIDYGYPDYVADNFKGTKYKLVDYDNFGVSGYTTVNLKNDILNSSKIRKEIKEATHITIDIGANDFLNILKTTQDTATVLGAIGEVKANLDTILSTIDKLNSKAKVYVMGYYNPFPYITDPAKQEQVQKLLEGVNAQIKVIAAKNGDTYVSTKIINNKDKYKEYLPNPDDIHLSKTGYKVVAKEFWKYIKLK